MKKKSPEKIKQERKEAIKTTLIVLTCIIALTLILGTAMYLLSKAENTSNNSFQNNKLPENPFVSEVVDGDTLKLSSGETIRLLCVNTPEEGEKGYEEATQFLESLVLSEEVRMVLGETSNNTDAYGRYLRFVYLDVSSGDEILVNSEIIRLGFGELVSFGEECGGIEN